MDNQHYKAESHKILENIGYLVCRARNLITAEFEKFFDEQGAALHTTFSQCIILMCLRDDLARTPTDISRYIGHDSGAVSRLINRLETRKWLRRKRSVEDRRIIELSLTPAGYKVAEAHIILVRQFYNELLADFTFLEADTLIHLLTKLVSRLSGYQSIGTKMEEPEYAVH